MAVISETPIQMLCLASLRKNLLALIGALSSFMRWLRSPSLTFSAHMKIQVQTLCGQVYPHHTRPANTVIKNRPKAQMISSQESRTKSCGQKVAPKM